ncbi:MAG: hypothetical protein ACFFCS_20525, partial [Candidatus Hodarchaeota archaeon]
NLKKLRKIDLEIIREFKLNDYLTVVLKKGKKEIHVAGKPTGIGSLNLLNRPKETNPLEYFETIDELAIDNFHQVGGSYGYPGKHSHIYRKIKKPKITPETEFWALCSNLQVWVEYDYDTRLLHSKLAFPLLKELTQAGDPLARKVFKKEIAERYASGHKSVITFLEKEGYLDYLDNDEK